MGSIPVEEHPPRKKRKTSKAESVPIWERTRSFVPEERKTASLPVIQQDGKVKRLNVQRPKFTAKAKKPTESTKQAETAEGADPLKHDDELRKDSKRDPLKYGAAHQKKARKNLESFAKKIERFEDTKARIGQLAAKIVANPEQNVALLRELRQMAHHYKGKAAALVILTESQLYKDILPTYKIRAVTEKEAETKVSKEVARLRSYEETLLKSYQRFAKSCVSLSRWRSGGGRETEAARSMARVRLAACKALAELVRSLAHFNEADIVATAVCGLVADREPVVRSQSADALKSVLGDAHRASGPTLQICVLIAKQLATVAVGGVHAAPPEVVEPLVEIQFVRFARLPSSSKAKNAAKKSKRFIKKRRRKPEKQGEATEQTELERDLQEANAEATPQEQYKARKKLLDSVCHTYFNIIKAAAAGVENQTKCTEQSSKRRRKPPEALPAALKGLLRVATFISTDVIEAILAALTPLLEKGRLPLTMRFRCLSASYAVLAVHSRTQKSDPDAFTGDARAMDASLYSALGRLYGTEMPAKQDERVTFDAVEAVVAFLSFREVPVTRCAAVARRLAVVAGAMAPTHACSIGLLRVAQQMLLSALVSPIYPQKSDRSENMEFRGEAGLIQSYDIGTDDPETANAERSAAWELACLASHFHPKVRDIARECSAGYCGARLPKTSENILLTVKGHSSEEGGFNPPPQDERVSNSKRARKHPLADGDDRVVSSYFGHREDMLAFLSESEDVVEGYFEAQWQNSRGCHEDEGKDG